MKYGMVSLFIMVFLLFSGAAQQLEEYHYSIVQMKFGTNYDVLKIKVPSWLKSSELIDQIKKVVFWPDEPLPQKIIYIYVFKETAQQGTVSGTGCIYVPGYGFHWDLRDWEPENYSNEQPPDTFISIYSDYVEQTLKKGSTLTNREIKKEIASAHNITISQLDSIYTQVKYWWENHAPRRAKENKPANENK